MLNNIKWSRFIKLSIELFFANLTSDRVFYSQFFFFGCAQSGLFVFVSIVFPNLEYYILKLYWTTIGEEAYFNYFFLLKSFQLRLIDIVLGCWLHFRKTIQFVNIFIFLLISMTTLKIAKSPYEENVRQTKKNSTYTHTPIHRFHHWLALWVRPILFTARKMLWPIEGPTTALQCPKSRQWPTHV